MKFICKNCNGQFYKPKGNKCPFCGSDKIDSLKTRKKWHRKPGTQVHKDKTKYDRNREKKETRKLKRRI